MSRSIWTLCGGASSARPLAVRAWRAVEAQHLVSTRRLVDSDRDQEVLEHLLERAKPPVPEDCRGLHYLLSTPFRYPPLAHGSRFGDRAERGIWYGSETREAVFAEVAYYRLLFLEGSEAELATLFVELSVFQASLATARAADLAAPPFDAYRDAIASPTRYDETQRLGRDMRADDVELARYPSARWPDEINLALFSPRAFTRKQPSSLETWTCAATREAVELARKSHFERRTLRFERERFLVDGALPAPAL